MISTALIVGAGDGLSAAIARKFAGAEVNVALAARKPDKLSGLCAESPEPESVATTCLKLERHCASEWSPFRTGGES